jgi:hypothetical protein
MVPIAKGVAWMADHGYRDQYPRRDAADPDVLCYTFVKDGHRRFGISSVRSLVDKFDFELLKQAVKDYEQGNHPRS